MIKIEEIFDEIWLNLVMQDVSRETFNLKFKSSPYKPQLVLGKTFFIKLLELFFLLPFTNDKIDFSNFFQHDDKEGISDINVRVILTKELDNPKY